MSNVRDSSLAAAKRSLEQTLPSMRVIIGALRIVEPSTLVGAKCARAGYAPSPQAHAAEHFWAMSKSLLLSSRCAM